MGLNVLSEPGGVEQVECGESGVSSTATQVVDMVPVSSMPDGMANILMPPPPQPPQSLPPGCPSWAARLRDCEVSQYCFILTLQMPRCT